MTVHKYVGSPHYQAKMMNMGANMDFQKLKTGMKDDFSGDLDHTNLKKMRKMMAGIDESNKPEFAKW